MISISPLRCGRDPVSFHIRYGNVMEQWSSLDHRTAGAVMVLASVRKPYGRLKVAGPGGRLDNTKLNSVALIERLSLMIFE